MKSTQELRETALFVLDEARKAGADQASVTISCDSSSSVTVRRGETLETAPSPESIESIPESFDLVLQTFIGKQNFVCRTTKLGKPALTSLIARALEVTRVRPADEFEGLPDPEQLASNVPSLEIYSPDCLELDTAQKIKLASDTESAAFSVDPRIFNSEGASFEAEESTTVYGNSHGFLADYTRSACSLSVSVIATQDGQLERGGWNSVSSRRNQLWSAEEVGKMAAQRALRGLGARQVASQKVPVIFERRVAGMLLANIAESLHGETVYQGQSFLANQIGNKIASSKLDITDDPFMPWGLASRPFGTHGIAMSKRAMISEGQLQQYFVDAKTARKLGTKPNGGGRSNLYVHAGETSVEDMIKSVSNGLYLTGLMGHGFNSVTGDYSFGASGVWIENGELAFPVHEITVAGNLKEMLHAIELIGNDLQFFSSINSPTLLIGSMMVGGK